MEFTLEEAQDMTAALYDHLSRVTLSEVKGILPEFMKQGIMRRRELMRKILREYNGSMQKSELLSCGVVELVSDSFLMAAAAGNIECKNQNKKVALVHIAKYFLARKIQQ